MRTSEIFSKGATLLAVFLLAACSGGGELGQGSGTGGGTGTGNGGDSGNSGAASVTLLSSSTELPSDADTAGEGIVLTALVKDSSNRALEGVPVSFSSTAGALVVASTTSASDGTATATLHTGGDSRATAGTTITVGARAGSLQSELRVINVVAPSISNPAVLRLGVLNGSNFAAGTMEISQSPLSAGGSSGISMELVDTANGNTLFTGTGSVSFNSQCIANGDARVDPNPAQVANGRVSVTYVALGCSGDDTITATSAINGQSQSATGTINVLPAAIGSIEFVSAEPQTIGLQGSGQTEQSTLVFQVKNSSGGPVSGQTVNFALNTTVGGISLTPAQGTTNNEGRVQTVVNAGSVHTAVRVTATATQGSTTVSSQSEQLLITTGLPDQDSFSLSAECFNIEALNRDGETTTLTLLAADRFNNPAPDGTAISFTAEGGAVGGGCTMVDGACSVTWRGQDPRPRQNFRAANGEGCGSSNGNGTDSSCANGPRNGRVTVLATALGEESFLDLDGDGRFDDNEYRAADDLAEAFRDDNEIDVDGDGSNYDAGLEEFADFNSNGVRDAADGRFNGLLCDGPGLCAAEGLRTVNVRESLTLIMSGSAPSLAVQETFSEDPATANGRYDGTGEAYVDADNDFSFDAGESFTDANGNGVRDGSATDEPYVDANNNGAWDAGDIFATSGGTFNNSRTFTMNAGAALFTSFVLRDVNDQPLPAGTTVEASVGGDFGALVGTTSYSVPCQTDDTAGANTYGFAYKAEAIDDGESGGTEVFELKVTSPSGLVTIFGFTIDVTVPPAAP